MLRKICKYMLRNLCI